MRQEISGRHGRLRHRQQTKTLNRAAETQVTRIGTVFGGRASNQSVAALKPLVRAQISRVSECSCGIFNALLFFLQFPSTLSAHNVTG
jgi:hypothetical protein